MVNYFLIIIFYLLNQKQYYYFILKVKNFLTFNFLINFMNDQSHQFFFEINYFKLNFIIISLFTQFYFLLS
jgi:hypothetical protein